MRLSKKYLNIVLYLNMLLAVVSCAGSGVKALPGKDILDAGMVEAYSDKETIQQRIRLLQESGPMNIKGVVRIDRSGRNIEGGFTMDIDSDNMRMVIRSNGLTVGKIELEGLSARLDPSFEEEYIEYMIAAVLRDSISWWNIHEYEVSGAEGQFVLRNSWKKVYLDPDGLVPVRQVISMTKQQNIEIRYTDVGATLPDGVPGSIEFEFNGIRSKVTVTSLVFRDEVIRSQDPDPLQPSE